MAVAALAWGADVATLREMSLILALVYAVTAAIGRPRAAWPVLVASFVVFAGATAQTWVSADAVLIGSAAAALLVGTACGRDRRMLGWQGVGVVVFGAAAVVAAEATPGWALVLVAGGWAAHAAWDVADLRSHRVVAASYAEWCAVFDLLVAVGLIVTGT